MAFNGSGVFNRLYNWVTDKSNAVPVTASRMDAEMDGMATGLSSVITKDGQTTTTARIPFASGTSAAAGTTASVSYSAQNDANTGIYFPASDTVALVAGGTAVLSSTPTVMTVDSGVALKNGTNPYENFASGTALLFQQTAAPTGWTKSSTHNDKAIRVVSGTVGSGGSVDFSTCFSRTTTDNVTLATTNLPAHGHTGTTGDQKSTHTHGYKTAAVKAGQATGFATVGGSIWAGADTDATSASEAGQGHQHDFTTANTGSGTAFSAGMDIRVKYADVIIATKD